jgi:transcription initiation factor TFIIB
MSHTTTTTEQHRTTDRSRSEVNGESESVRATETLACPECGGRLATDEGHGEVVCTDCGLVVEEDSIDHGPEWRAFESGERTQKSRVGAPTTKMMHDDGLSTDIDWQNRDAHGRTLSASQRRRMQRLRTWNERFRTRDAKERNLKQALSEIDRMASALGLPETVRETASVIYRRALNEDLLPGRSIEGVATASLYAAARQAGTPRSLDEFAAVSRVDRMEITRTYRYVVRELKLKIRPTDPEEYLPRLVSELDLSDNVERIARELLDDARRAAIHSGKSPVGLAAAAVYAGSLLANERTTQSAVGTAANVSEVTIRNRYKELLDVSERATVA